MRGRSDTSSDCLAPFTPTGKATETQSNKLNPEVPTRRKQDVGYRATSFLRVLGFGVSGLGFWLP